MIHFACLSCGMKFNVKDEFAGRSTKCPTCKSPVHVPDASTTQAYVPADSIDGSESSLDKAGVNPSVTLAPQSGKDPASVDALPTKQVGRYVIDKEIARGGMGAVLRGIDRDIRREVAIKFMLNDQDAKQKARFVEEAQITGQLEHPNIVPVHELGVDAKKRLFFTMKMVKGRSLAQILEMLAKNPNAEREWSLGRLLNFLVNICHALAFAHSRNVIHRDLKPANIMVGDFGEVYVMDWGLAKVLGEKAPSRKASKEAFSATPLTSASVSGPSVSTSREMEGELTQDGAIMGTPAYMPPEQALGNIHAIDQRSDIYSLGAILYAVLTLKSPVEKDGNHVALLMRVVEGNIKKPEVRTPDRHIPLELSAIAMKALGKEPKDRYPTVEAFRRDLELFLEGRSVSAKEDTVREQVWKLVKRNKGASLATAAALVVLAFVLAVAFQINISARVFAEGEQVKAKDEKTKAEQAYRDFETEQNAKEEAVRHSLPALVRAGRQLANENQIDQAEEQVKLALTYDADHPEAWLLKGQILTARKQWTAARAELQRYRGLRPKDAEAGTLLDAITRGQPDDGPTLLAVIESLQRQKVQGLAAPLLPDLEKLVAAKAHLVPVYRTQIEARWKGLGGNLVLDKDGKIRLDLTNQYQVGDLAPLKGMKLNRLKLSGCRQIKDLEPLRGMPLHFMDLGGCQMESLEPLRGMPLTQLVLHSCKQVSDLEPLSGMKLTALDLTACYKVRDLGPLQTMPLEELYLNSCGLIDDLGPLRGRPLKTLGILACRQISSLEPLQGMPLTYLDATGVQLVKDLSPLRNMPLTVLYLTECRLSDLEPLRGMKLTRLVLAHCPVENLEPLRGMPLTWLELFGSRVKNLEPLRGMPLTSLRIDSCRIQDVAPLQGLPLQSIYLTPTLIEKNIDALRNMKSLKSISAGQRHTPEEFWKRYDAGEFKK